MSMVLPHFHAFYQGFEAVFDIKTSERKKGAFPKKQEKMVVEWAGQNQIKLLKNWKLARNGKQGFRIPGADK